MLQKNTTPRSKVNPLWLLAQAAALTALVPACGAPPAGELGEAEAASEIEAAGEGEAASEIEAARRPPLNPCAVVLCQPGFTCEEQNGRAVCVASRPAPYCKTDADCRLTADYCGGCNCLALAPGERAPKCPGEEVACLVWPCRGLEARCEDGACVAE